MMINSDQFYQLWERFSVSDIMTELTMNTLKLIPITNKGKQRSGTKHEVEVTVIRSLDKCPCFNSSPGLFVQFPNNHERWIRLDGSPEFKVIQ